MRKIISMIIVGSLFITGCSLKDSVNKTYSEKSEEMLSLNENTNTLKNGIQEKKNAKQFVMTEHKKVSEALEEIGLISERTYILTGDDMDLPYAPNYSGVKDFYTLQEYIEDTTNKTLEIVKNKYSQNRVKVVQIKDKEQIGKDLQEIKFSLKGQDTDFKTAIQDFIKKTGFSVVYGNGPKSTSSSISATASSNNDSNNDFTSKLISYNGITAQQFINYLKTSFDLYIDVDYANKLVKIEKYRLKEMPLLIANRVISKNGNSMLQASETSSSSKETSSVQSKMEISVYEAFNKALGDLSININQKTGDLNFVSLDANTGIVSIYATSSAMNILEDKIKNFNRSYTLDGYATITIFELIVNNKITAGTDVTYNNTSSIRNSTIEASTSLTSALNNAITFANKSGNGTRTLDIVAKSLSEIGYISKKTEYGGRFRNHVPSSLKELTVTNYVKNSQTNVQNSTTTSTTTTSTETEQIVAGSESIVLPKIYGDTISIYVSLSDTVIESITKETYGTTQINIPVTKPRSIEDEFVLKVGESKIIKHITAYEDADKYKGVIPLKDFILGGQKDKELIRKELIYMLSINL